MLAALLLAVPLASPADEAPATATLPISGNVELGLSDELSRFTEVRIGDSPAILVPGQDVRRTEPFRHFAAQVNASVPCGIKNVNCVADVSYDTHTGLRTGDVDTVVAQGDAGFQYGYGKSIFGVKLDKERWSVGGNEFRRIDGVNLDWVASVTDRLASYVLVQLSRYRHPGDQSSLDSNYAAVTGNLRYATQDAWQSGYTVQATLSREANVNDDPTLDVKAVLVRLAWDSKPAEGWELGVSGIAQRSSFGAFDPILDVRRVDRYAGADVQLARRLTKDLSIRLDLAYAWYRSTANSFDNDWASIGTMLIWKF
ncbi:MAG: hypothetical protein ACM3SO_22800 [Betaproteobacteria bacterium]